jgi:hypothetical protein
MVLNLTAVLSFSISVLLRVKWKTDNEAGTNRGDRV